MISETVLRNRQGNSVQAAASEFGVQYLLEGCLQRPAQRYRLTLQLVWVQDDVTIWAEVFDEESAYPFVLENSFAMRVAQAFDHRQPFKPRKG
jgi:adenylate cyclase